MLMTPYSKAMYFMALFINASNDFLGYKRAMKIFKKEFDTIFKGYVFYGFVYKRFK
ncbi:hypothetical protein [Campylobacter upsaliensis]|uniref:hypothetical protein n=1 Tax=Campylobacter upsaliensis TaxID=28080 RepID=UPI0022EAA56C|nr:hypothetical protein [Campylobacter upsaliensis]